MLQIIKSYKKSPLSTKCRDDEIDLDPYVLREKISKHQQSKRSIDL